MKKKSDIEILNVTWFAKQNQFKITSPKHLFDRHKSFLYGLHELIYSYFARQVLLILFTDQRMTDISISHLSKVTE